MADKNVTDNEEKKSLSFVEQIVESDLAEAQKRRKDTNTFPA